MEELYFYRSLECELGDILALQQECPGVYYISARGGEDITPGEYYVAAPGAAISELARAYGHDSLHCPGLLLFPFEDEAGGRYVLDYEIFQYKLQNRLPLPEHTSLHTLAVFGREHCPDYFGPFPAPTMTPWGAVLRYQTVDHGVHWLELERGPRALSVCCPLCEELSEAAVRLARRTGRPLDCLFFTQEDSCIPILELMELRPGWSTHIHRTALMNAVILHHPEYAMLYNLLEQQGLRSPAGVFLDRLGISRDAQDSTENTLIFTEGVGTEFFRFG